MLDTDPSISATTMNQTLSVIPVRKEALSYWIKPRNKNNNQLPIVYKRQLKP